MSGSFYSHKFKVKLQKIFKVQSDEMAKKDTFVLDNKLKEDGILLGAFTLSKLLLIKDRQFPWFILVPERNNVEEIYHLTDSDQSLLWKESKALSQTIMKHFGGDKLNIGAIGNVVSQLHLHHVVRYKSDLLWPKPIWGQLVMKDYELDELKRMIRELLPKLVEIGLTAEIE